MCLAASESINQEKGFYIRRRYRSQTQGNKSVSGDEIAINTGRTN
jgi:hypothetical protein